MKSNKLRRDEEIWKDKYKVSDGVREGKEARKSNERRKWIDHERY